MSAKIVSKTQDSVTLEITVPLSDSMLECEELIRDTLNEGGRLAVGTALERFDTDGSPIMVGDTKLTSRGRFNKVFQSIWGEVAVERHTYQSSQGGRQYYPLENAARIILTATPGLAKLVSSKYAEMGSSRVLTDLADNHGRKLSRPYLKMICDAVGAIAEAKEESWSYELPKMERSVKSVSVGIDGTCMLLLEDGWREAMVGTLSLYDNAGDRMHTIQIGATPEYGKGQFFDRFDRELNQLKAHYPKACFVGVADGAKCNWEYLQSRTDKQTIDFWHATGYLGKAADAMFPKNKDSQEKHDWLDQACHNLKHKQGAASRLLREMVEHRESNQMKKSDAEKLEPAISYFTNNKNRMRYAANMNNNLPIGSGVTEAACKTLVKQRLCNSGMRWKEKGAAAVLTLRALMHTSCRWNQFWSKVSQYGVPALQ